MDQENLDSLIYNVAVDFAPIVWQLWCEICDVGQPTSDGDRADVFEIEHRKFHGYEGMD
jgi:hypothetical protein